MICVCVCVCVWLSYTNKKFSDTSRVSENSTQIWCSQESVRFHRLRAQSSKTTSQPPPSPFQIPVKSPSKYLYFWQTDYQLKHPMISSLDLINLLEWLTELRKPIYSPDFCFIIEEYNSGTATWMRCIGQGWGNGQGASVLSHSLLLSPNFQMFTNLDALWTLFFCRVLWRLHYIAMVD